MKKTIFIIGLIALTVFCGLYAKRKIYDPKQRLKNGQAEVKKLTSEDVIKSGDIIFQTSLSGQSKAIQLENLSTCDRD